MPDALTFVPFATITKVADDPDDPNAVFVYGKATSDDLDLDDQIIDRDFARKGMQDWFSSYANIRQMHSPNLPPAGKGIELVNEDDGIYVRAHVVEPTAVKLCREGVYAAYSVGIAGPRVITDKVARNGRIVGGTFVELSLVDRPANPSCRLSLAKMAGDELDETQAVEKKDYSDDQRSDMADSGEAMADGSYPIKTEADLKNAISSYGRAKDPDKVRAHIIARAKALKLTNLLPANWPGSTKPKGQPVEEFARKRLHDLYCPAYSLDAVCEAYPAVEKNGVASSLGPLAMQSVFQMLSQEVAEDGGSGSCSDDICTIAKTYALLCDYVSDEAAEALMAARNDLHKVFRQVNNLTKALAPKPVDTPNPAQFRRPYLQAGRQRELATSTDNLSLPMNGRVVDAADFQRGPLTAGHEADSPANKAGKAGYQPAPYKADPDETVKCPNCGKMNDTDARFCDQCGTKLAGNPAVSASKDATSRLYYTNAAKDDMNALLQSIHDHLSANNAEVCPMDAPADEPAVITAIVFDNRDDALPTPVAPQALAAAGVAKRHKAPKEQDMTPKQARKLARKMADEAVTKAETAFNARIGELSDMVNKLASAPDPAQAAIRGGEPGAVMVKAEEPGIVKAADDGDDYRRFLEHVSLSGRGLADAASDALLAATTTNG